LQKIKIKRRLDGEIPIAADCGCWIPIDYHLGWWCFFSKSPRWEHLTCLLVSITRSVVEYLSIPIRVGQYRMGCVAWNKGYFQFWWRAHDFFAKKGINCRVNPPHVQVHPYIYIIYILYIYYIYIIYIYMWLSYSYIHLYPIKYVKCLI
jgi:hypothetical protein